MKALDKLLEYAICGLAHNNRKTDIAREWKKEVEDKIEQLKIPVEKGKI